jgi:hypothetical protein
MGRHASPLLVAESGPGVECVVATGAKTLTGAGGGADVTGFFVVVAGAVVVGVGAAGVGVVIVEVWPEAAVDPPVAIALGDAALLEELLEPQPLSTRPKHAIGPSAISALNLNTIATRS